MNRKRAVIEEQISEMEAHLLALLEKVRRHEVRFLATTFADHRGVIEQRHLSGEAPAPAGRSIQ